MFITFEGCDGSGKSTQARELHARLGALSIPCLLLREPGGTHFCEQVRRLLIEPAYALSPMTQALLFTAARTNLVSSVIRPALDDDLVVVCDRFTDSTLAYQSYGNGLPAEDMYTLNGWATGGLVPDLTIYLDIGIEEGVQRKRRQGEFNVLDAAARAVGEKIRHGYRELMLIDPFRWRWFDATEPSARIAEAIWQEVQRHPSFPLVIDL